MNQRLFMITIQARVFADSYDEVSRLASNICDRTEDYLIQELNLQFDADIDIVSDVKIINE